MARPGAGFRVFRSCRQSVGLLGGSFNPAHDGHRHVMHEALKQLGLDWVWWLPSPQNPLKPRADMAPLAARTASAQAQARHPRARVGAIEQDLGTRYAVDTLAALRRRFPRLRFVWLMGADLPAQLPRWRRWTRFLALAPIAVFTREPYVRLGLASRFAQRYRRRRVTGGALRRLADHPPPAWAYIVIRAHPESSSRLRELERTAPSTP